MKTVPRGAIIFYSFLPERGDLDLADRELLRLLSMFAGPSLFNHLNLRWTECD